MQRNAFACVSNARPSVDLSTGQYKTRTADYGLRIGYKIRTRYKTRTGKYGLGIKRGLQTADWV